MPERGAGGSSEMGGGEREMGGREREMGEGGRWEKNGYGEGDGR